MDANEDLIGRIDDNLNIFRNIVAAHAGQLGNSTSSQEQETSNFADDELDQFCAKIDFAEGTESKLKGTCFNFAAQISYIGKQQALLYSKYIQLEFVPRISTRKY